MHVSESVSIAETEEAVKKIYLITGAHSDVGARRICLSVTYTCAVSGEHDAAGVISKWEQRGANMSVWQVMIVIIITITHHRHHHHHRVAGSSGRNRSTLGASSERKRNADPTGAAKICICCVCGGSVNVAIVVARTAAAGSSSTGRESNQECFRCAEQANSSGGGHGCLAVQI